MFQQGQEIFNILLGSISEGIFVVDEHQNIVETNDSAEKMFGYNDGELINQSLNILIPQNDQSKHVGHFKEFIKHREHRKMGQGRDVFGMRKDGSIFPAEVGLNSFKIYDKNYIMALIIDTSIRKKQEQKIQELNKGLEKTVLIRTKELSESILKLETENKKRIEAEENVKSALKNERELNELKTKFLSLVSHEFKTPLSGILTSAMLLSKYKLEEQQDKRDKHIKTISDKVHYLNKILNDFLSVEKLESGKVNYRFSTFKLSKVINEVVYNANMLLKDGQQINYPKNIDDISLYQDEKIVELSLSNVLHNALKYSPENTVINIEINQNKSLITFVITDMGIGIPEKDKKNIFNRYFRAENVLHTQGTGIGLNIVKNHLENLGGTISFKSSENKGSTFSITVPNKVE